MTSVRPWLDQDLPDPLRRMLTAARMQQPSAAQAERAAALVALMLTTGTANGGAEPAATSAATTSIAEVKWALLGGGLAGVLAASLAILGVQQSDRVAARTPLPQETADALPPKSQSEIRPHETPTQFPQVGDLPEVDDENRVLARLRPKRSSPAKAAPPAKVPILASRENTQSVDSPTLAPPSALGQLDTPLAVSQSSFIDRARNALKQRQALLTLQLLDQYHQAFAHRQFDPEALQLRMRAHLALGDSAEARRAAEYLVRHHPTTPQGKDALEFLGR